MNRSTVTLAVIPARGGSTQLRRKNVLPIAGKPLFLATARAAALAGCHVVVSTDDREIASIATVNGYDLHWRTKALADVPVDRVVDAAVKHMQHDGPVLLIQPTVQPITADVLRSILKTVDGGAPAAVGYQDRHISWFRDTPISRRVQRQDANEWPVRELGIRWWPTPAITEPQRIVQTVPLEDIDTAGDYQALRGGKHVRFVYRANKLVGSGHLRRSLLLAEHLQHHRIDFQPTLDTEAWAIQAVRDRGWTLTAYQDLGVPDVWINDTLDTDELIAADPTYLAAGARLHLEDSGSRRYVDATINALYHTPGAYSGADWADIRPEFIHTPYTVREDARQVMLLFGGTDPTHLGPRIKSLLDPTFDVDLILPADDRMIAAAMQSADVLITSGGRTVFEAAAVGIPTIVLSQNIRETTHTHLGKGNLHLGLGTLVTDSQILHTVAAVLDDYRLRQEMSDTGKRSVDGLGVSRIAGMVDWLAAHRVPPRMEGA